MKNHSSLFILLMWFLFFESGCSKDDTPDREPMPELQVSKSEIVFTDLGGTIELLVAASVDWEANLPITDSWCTVEKFVSGIKVKTVVNNQMQERQVLLTLTAGELSKTVTIKQEAQEKKVYKITVPDFTESYVYKVMDGDVKIAEICKEYINDGQGGEYRFVVAYPVDKDGKTNQTEGFVVDNGGTIMLDPGDGKCLYSPGDSDTPLTELYLGTTSGRLNGVGRTDATAAVVEPEFLVDKRGAEINTYKIVKIGSQYWTAENFRALYLTDGTRIHPVAADRQEVGFNQKKPFCIARDQADAGAAGATQEREKYGLFYNWYAYSSGKLEPEGWELPTKEDCDMLVDYLGGSSVYADKLTEVAAGGKATNVTGFSIQVIGYYYDDTPYPGYWAFWTSTVLDDWGNVQAFMGVFYPSMARLDMNHYCATIRLIRK